MMAQVEVCRGAVVFEIKWYEGNRLKGQVLDYRAQRQAGVAQGPGAGAPQRRPRAAAAASAGRARPSQPAAYCGAAGLSRHHDLHLQQIWAELALSILGFGRYKPPMSRHHDLHLQ